MVIRYLDNKYTEFGLLFKKKKNPYGLKIRAPILLNPWKRFTQN